MWSHQLKSWWPAFAVQDSGLRNQGRDQERVESDSQALRSEAQTRIASSTRGVERVQRAAFSVWGLRRERARERVRERAEGCGGDWGHPGGWGGTCEGSSSWATLEGAAPATWAQGFRPGFNPNPDGPKPARYTGQWSFIHEIEETAPRTPHSLSEFVGLGTANSSP